MTKPNSSGSQSTSNKNITSVADMIERVKGIHDWEASSKYEWYYRGESNEKWSIESSINRVLYDEEGMMLTDLRTRHPDKFLQYSTAFSHWVLAQHYGLPTRLLDVTKNPLVALYFACQDDAQCKALRRRGKFLAFRMPKQAVKPFNSDAISIVANFARLNKKDQEKLIKTIDCIDSEDEAKKGFILTNGLTPNENFIDRLYGYVREEKPGFKERIDSRDFFRIFAVNPERSFDRIRVQSGAFIISARSLDFIKANAYIDDQEYNVYKVHVDKKKKENIIKELELLGVTRENLFPGLEESSEAIQKKYRT